MFIKSVFLRAVAAVVCAFMLIGVGTPAGGEYDAGNPEGLKLNFAILSDSHIEGNNYARYKVFARSLKNVKQHKSGHDAIVFLGDNTMNCQIGENLLFHGTVSALLGDEHVIPVIGNHDIGNGQGDYETLQNRWYSYTDAFFGRKLSHPYYYDVIDGCYFIVLGPEAQKVYDMVISDEQFEWLEGVLAEAAETQKPCFVFSHYPTDDATDGEGRSTTRLTDMLASYAGENDIFAFVGHTHMPLFLFWSFHTYDGYPETYLPRLTDLSGDDNEVFDRSGIGMEVEVYENEVVLRGRNFYTGEWLVDDEDDGTMCEVRYPLKHSF